MITVLHLRNAKTGAPYRKTLEYGFALQEAMDARFGNGRDTSKLTLSKVEPDMYACGFLPPHYPVPSTLGDVHTTKLAVYLTDPKGYDCVACWSKNTGTQTI